MTYSTSNTYQLKRKIVTFSNKISEGLSKSERKFSANMIYGMLASKSCLLTDIVDQLHEPSKKINGVDRLSKHLAKGLPITASQNHLNMIKNWIPSEPVVHLDDSDVIRMASLRILWYRSGWFQKQYDKKCLSKRLSIHQYHYL